MMKRKLNNFSNFKYKRRCPVLKEDVNKNTIDSDEEIPIEPSQTLCDSVNGSTNTTDCIPVNEMYSSKDVLDSCSDEDTPNSSSKKVEKSDFDKDDKQYRLDVLKGIFKNEYSEEKLMVAINDSDGLNHGVSILIDSGSEDEQEDADDLAMEEDLAELMKKFPGCDKENLQNVLEAHSFCLEDAIAALEIFQSPEKNKSKTQNKNIDFDKVVESIFVDDNSDDAEKNSDRSSDICELDFREPEAAPNMPGCSKTETMKNHDNCNDNYDEEEIDLSDRQQDLAMSSADKALVLSFLNKAEVFEISLVKGCSITKAQKICSLRPFNTWMDLLREVCNTKGLDEEILWECQLFVNERNKMESLMNKCEGISKDIKNLFEVKSSTTEDSSVLVTKKQYVTKEPNLVAAGFKLKDYQLIGLNWLIAIHKQGLNGILADEMGLGKTIQAIVFLAYIIEQDNEGRHIIIVPSSTFDNWKRELGRWCPSIKCLDYSGSQAERANIRDEILDSVRNFQVLLTTYTIATSTPRDRVFLKKLELDYAVFDEAHMLKNMRSQRYQQLIRIKPRRMLMLTGTPIQNNLLELMSLLSFVMPDLFAERIEGIKLLFGDKVKNSKEQTAYHKEKVIQVKRIMEPFVMRRVKKDVLGNNLPEKREHIIECDVPSRQRNVYNKVFTSCCNIIQSSKGEIQSKSMGLLIELRKAANHPLLIRSYYTDDMLSKMAQKYCKDPSHRDSEVNFVFEDMQVMSDFELSRLCLEERCLKDFHLPHELVMDCGKFLYLDSILPKMKEKGDRVLLFNQFTMTMDIVEVYLQTRGYKYLRFDGSIAVNERQILIDRFNTEEDIFIFILSTKAGGLGINLTSANVVILYDSDYNPHNDKQAEDRCHRLGQTREVNVYRLLCKDTIEKAILNCANDKIRLHEDISGNQNSDREDIRGLISAVFGSWTRKLKEN